MLAMCMRVMLALQKTTGKFFKMYEGAKASSANYELGKLREL